LYRLRIMTIEKNQKINILIKSYLGGELNDSECAELVEWMDTDPENVAYFREYADAQSPLKSEMLDSGWAAMKHKRQLRESADKLPINGDFSWGRKVLSISRIQFAKYAAILIIGVISLMLSLNQLSDHLNSKDNTQWIQAKTQAGQKTQIVLPDSSVVWLNSESVISFPTSFKSQKKRIVRLEGEAFFDVADQGRSLFIVQCRDYNVEVHGTRFNVMAYRDFNRTETTLLEGAVKITNGKQSITLLPGERAIASGNYLTKSRANVRQASAWTENKFYFDNVSFTELARRLERWYDVKITLEDKSLNDIYYSGYFKNEETVWQVLDVIKMTTPIIYERKQFREIRIGGSTN
jgi:transmembrane sensor